MKNMTAENLITSLRKMPVQERQRFFLLVGQQAFSDENFSHDEVFGDLAEADFTAAEAAEYLEVSMATFRRLVRDGKLAPHAEVGRSQLFAAADLKAFKRQRKAVKG
ncbi:MAG: helix-turn-helix domain-containing protein [Cupriavidus sp.]|nr:helix-turn-helix domain-containing protein [Cupriavidus sp.]